MERTARTPADGNNLIHTFGENIHLIMKNSFFLTDGTIGSFAVSSINNTAQSLEKMKTMLDKGSEIDLHELERCKAIANLVAPGILRSRLYEIIEQVEQKLCPDDKERELAALRRRVKLLEEELSQK